ncbi:phage tail protein [Rummeliibacillus stabekisii]|uniref:SH3b domain-containing protein n=1 Tax=Rummeliibacillus stabekisii TaxID=241244 RepID=A0A143HCV2_9BACL|nr:phage tail protein [Rummeliibacillus stabekisii]AMW99305.1 hypothetical protein ATY39_07400 [Rummeliibacillus stabekisii]
MATSKKKTTKKAKTKLGSFAGITFVVSRKKILTFSELKRDDVARWTDHEVLNGKSISEFLGPGLSAISLKIELRKSLGISNPYSQLSKLRKFASNGKTSAFILGKNTISNGKFKIESIGQEFEEIAPNGEVLTISVDLTLKEFYSTTVKKATISKAQSKKTAKKKSAAKSKAKTTGTITVKPKALNVRMSPSLKGKIKKTLKKGDKVKVYGTKKTDITWYNLGGGLYCSAGSSYVSFKKS